MTVSEKLKRAVKLSPMRAYQIAHRCNLHPSTLSQIVNGIVYVKPGDPRVLRVAKVVGVSENEAFTQSLQG